MKKYVVLLFFALFTLTCFAQTQLQPAATLPFYLTKVVDTNPEIQARWQDLRIALADIDIARAGYRPQVDALVTSGYTDRNYSLNRQFTGHTAQVALTQRLYDGFFTRSEVRRFKQAQMVRYYELLGEIEQKSLDTTLAYLDVQLFRELLVLAEQNLITHVNVFKQIEESVQAGVGRRADLEQISGRLSLAESNVLTELSNLHDVTARFLRLVGENPAPNLADAELVFPQTATDFTDLHATLFFAYQHNPAFNAAVYNIDSQLFSVESAQSQYHPQVNLTASYGTQTRDETGQDNTITEARVGLNISLNLYNGGADSAAVQQALARVDQAKDVRLKACRDMRQTIQIAQNDILNISRQLPSLNAHRLSSDRVKSAYMDQFTLGKRSLLDLLDSENEYYESSRAYTQANYTLKKARARLLASSGTLTSAFGIVNRAASDAQENAQRTPEFDPAHVCPAIKIGISDEPNILTRDSDEDGVTDLWDSCSASAPGSKVDHTGCEIKPVQHSAADFSIDNAQIIESATLDITFQSNVFGLSAQSKSAIISLAEKLVGHPDTGVIVQGHASLEGDPVYNQRLSEQRANAVAALLLKQEGVLPHQVTSVGYGASRPLMNELSEEANKVNRRIEITFIRL